MTSSMLLSVQDLVGEGASAVLDRLVGYGVQSATVAVAYHRARDVTPHGKTRLTMRTDGVHLPVAGAGFTELVPPEQPARLHLNSGLIAAISERGLGLDGWVVICHNTSLGLRHPELTQVTCFGDRAAPADLCPAQPRVRTYARQLAVAVARLGVESVVAESLHYGTFDHGYHHERSFVELSQVDRFLLGICFCNACGAAADARGEDAKQAAAEARRALEPVMAGRPGPAQDLTPDFLGAHVGPAFAAFAAGRTQVVTSLAAEVGDAVETAGAKLLVLDMTGAVKGYASGTPAGALAAQDAWQVGVDVAAVAGTGVVHIGMLAYARSSGRIAADVAAYRDAIGPGPLLRALLRPSAPDCASADDLTAHVRVALAAGADAIGFYHYGLCTFADLERVPQALHAVAGEPV